MIPELDGAKMCAGIKSVLRMMKRRETSRVFVANDADRNLKDKVAELAEILGIEVVYADSMKELGKSCGINRPAAAAAVLSE